MTNADPVCDTTDTLPESAVEGGCRSQWKLGSRQNGLIILPLFRPGKALYFPGLAAITAAMNAAR